LDGGSDLDRARAALHDHPDQAKLILYGRLTRGGTREELTVLKAACHATGDMTCEIDCNKRLGLR
jgi:hypothetical protein